MFWRAVASKNLDGRLQKEFSRIRFPPPRSVLRERLVHNKPRAPMASHPPGDDGPARIS